MKAAVVRRFDQAPAAEDLEVPVPQLGEVLVSVRAAALSQLVRSQAAGKHYTSLDAQLPFVPGADGVGRLPDGRRVYFAFPRPPVGAMAEYVAVRQTQCAPIPDDLDDVTAAAIGNPGMSSWAALTLRAGLVRGETVLINGATGVSGRLAIQIAKHLGARRVVATGRSARSEAALRALGADEYVPLDRANEALIHAFTTEITGEGVDVVLDYLWGTSAECILAAATTHVAGEAARRVRYVQIGALGGASISLPAATLRSSGVELLGSGLGSLSNEAAVRATAEMLRAAVAARLTIEAQPFPLVDVARAWTAEANGRVVLTM